MGAVPGRARGLGHMVPTYNRRDHAGSTPNGLRGSALLHGARDGMHDTTSSANSTSESVVAAKVAMRAAAKARRAALPAETRRAGAAAVAALDWPALIGPAPRIVSAFRSMGEELDTGPLLERLASLRYRLCLPVMQGRKRPLLFRAWAPGDAMATVIWGIEEPTADKLVLEPDVVLLPLLAFDRAGGRLGYGGGFYDRTLQELRSRRSIRAIGLAFAEQEVDVVPHLDYDEPLDAVLTPRGLIELRA